MGIYAPVIIYTKKHSSFSAAQIAHSALVQQVTNVLNALKEQFTTTKQTNAKYQLVATVSDNQTKNVRMEIL